jgi:hypothetical protein
VAELRALDIKRSRVFLGGDPGDIARLDIEELGVLVDEAAQEPRARDAIGRRSCESRIS